MYNYEQVVLKYTDLALGFPYKLFHEPIHQLLFPDLPASGSLDGCFSLGPEMGETRLVQAGIQH